MPVHAQRGHFHSRLPRHHYKMPLRQWLLQIAVQRVFVQDQGRGAVPMPCWPRHSGATETGRSSCHEQKPTRPLRHGWSKDRKSVVKGKRVSVRVDLGGRRINNKKTKHKKKR